MTSYLHVPLDFICGKVAGCKLCHKYKVPEPFVFAVKQDINIAFTLAEKGHKGSTHRLHSQWTICLLTLRWSIKSWLTKGRSCIRTESFVESRTLPIWIYDRAHLQSMRRTSLFPFCFTWLAKEFQLFQSTSSDSHCPKFVDESRKRREEKKMRPLAKR